MAVASTSAPSPSTFRVRIVGHESNIDPLTKSPIILYRTMVNYNGQTFERALRYSRFYTFHLNMKPADQKAIRLAEYMAAVTALPLTLHMEAALLRLLEIRRNQTHAGSLAPLSDSASTRSGHEPVLRIFTKSRDDHGSFCSSSRSSYVWQSSASEVGSIAPPTEANFRPSHVENVGAPPPVIVAKVSSLAPSSAATSFDDIGDDDDISLFEEALTEPVAVPTASEIAQAAVAQRKKVQALLQPAEPTTPTATSVDPTMLQDAIRQHKCVIDAMLQPACDS
ncbi:hypothetical protein ACHHYP_13238 [Achlya hypogyna]|uniref:PX domain-containing protein n=1 Tax=Achlya hypogyna TaxID=1202772 RepID=A0A1V9YFU0_ACHHY|nr:hypothetical protein ACHHYP_13238 [Achlya hypogyna]